MSVALLKFRYVNHNDEEHTYVIKPEPGLHFLPGSALRPQLAEKHWSISGHVLTRNGEDRNNVRRTFVLVKMQDLEEVFEDDSN